MTEGKKMQCCGLEYSVHRCMQGLVDRVSGVARFSIEPSIIYINVIYIYSAISTIIYAQSMV